MHCKRQLTASGHVYHRKIHHVFKACANEKVTLEIVQLLYNTLPDALRLRDGVGYLPIRCLCYNRRLDENTSIDILQFMLDRLILLCRWRRIIVIGYQFIMPFAIDLLPSAK